MDSLKLTGVIVSSLGILALSQFILALAIILLTYLFGLEEIEPYFEAVHIVALILTALPGIIIVSAGVIIYDKRLVLKIKNKYKL